MTVKRISVWSGPRNVSTALMYAFAQRGDTTVVDEPLYAHYLNVTGADHPGREEVLNAQEIDPDNVIRKVILGSYSTPVLFIKNMAHHLIDIDRAFLNKLINVLLIRDPDEMLPSLLKVIPRPTLRDTAYNAQYRLFELLKEQGSTPVIIDSKELLTDPPVILRKLCERVGIPFEGAMLSWEAGPRPEDGVWARYWYDTVHRSTGFKPYRPKQETVPDAFTDLLEKSRRYYEKLYRHALKVSG